VTADRVLGDGLAEYSFSQNGYISSGDTAVWLGTAVRSSETPGHIYLCVSSKFVAFGLAGGRWSRQGRAGTAISLTCR